MQVYHVDIHDLLASLPTCILVYMSRVQTVEFDAFLPEAMSAWASVKKHRVAHIHFAFEQYCSTFQVSSPRDYYPAELGRVVRKTALYGLRHTRSLTTSDLVDLIRKIVFEALRVALKPVQECTKSWLKLTLVFIELNFV